MATFRLRIFLSLCCSSLLALPTPGHAQGAGPVLDEQKLSELSLEDLLELKVTTASKSEEVRSESPATVYVITSDTIRERGYRSLNELLADIPEVEIQDKSVTEYNNLYTMRGINGNNRFQVLLDGNKIISATGTPQAVRTNVSLGNAKRVEVILGPASALYGADAFTGVVNIITEGLEDKSSSKFEAQGGMYSTVAVQGAIHHKFNDLVALTLAADYYHSEEPNLPNEYPQLYQWYFNEYLTTGAVLDATGAVQHVAIQPYKTPTESHFIEAKLDVGSFEVGYSQNQETHSSSVAALPSSHVYAADATYGLFNQTIWARHRFNPEGASWGLETSASQGTEEILPTSAFVNVFTGFTPGYKYGIGVSSKFEEQLHWKPTDNHSLILGASYEDSNALPKTGDLPVQFDPNSSADSQKIPYLGTSKQPIYQDFYNIHYTNFGSLIQLQSQWHPMVKTTLGTRADYNSRYEWTVNPRAGIVLTPVKKTAIRFLYGEAYLAPSPYLAYQHYGAFVDIGTGANGQENYIAPFWHLPNPALKPEKLRTIESGASFYPAENVNLAVDVYYNFIDNIVQDTGVTGLSFKGIPVSFAIVPENQGSGRTYGGSVVLNTLQHLGPVRMNASVAYSYVDGSIDRLGVPWKTVPYAANHTGKVTLDLALGDLTVSPRLLLRSRSYHPLNGNTANATPDSAPGYAVVNLAARYRVRSLGPAAENSSIFLKVSNLFNRHYYNVSFGQSEVFSATPQDPIRVEAGVTLSL